MKLLKKLWRVVAVSAFYLALGGVAVLGLWAGIFPGLCVCLVYGWMIFAFFSYRWGRQEEVRQLLITAAESQAPLAPLLREYLKDRPHGRLREVWVATLLFFVIPGYYWFWHRRHRFDSKVARLARRLENGAALPEALRSVPGVTSAETVLAAALAETTGDLAGCLRRSPGRPAKALWLEVLPRILYPVIICLFLIGIVGFWMTFIGPKMHKIFDDFKVALPWSTALAMRSWEGLTNHGVEVVLAVWLAAALAIFLLSSSNLRWYIPGLGRLYRMEMQSRVLQSTAMLLETGQTVPRALSLLAGSDYFPSAVRRRLDEVRRYVEQGEPLGASMRRGGLLPRSSVSLIEAAERMRNLPWALNELGVTLANRLVRLLRRLSLALFPATVFAVAAVTGFLVISMFLPLITLISSMG